jgi:hypothetical protein
VWEIKEAGMFGAFRIAVIALFLANLLTPAGAAEPLERPTLSAQGATSSLNTPLWRLGGSAEALAVLGSYAYLAQGMHLHVIHVDTGLVMGTISFPYPVRDVAVSGDYAYVVTSGYGDLHVVDVHDPTRPTQVGLGPLQGGGEGLAVRWPYVYVLGGPGEMLVIFNVTAPTAPVRVKALSLTQYGRWAKLGDSHLYVVSWLGHLGILDISDPLDPQERSWLSLGAENLSVAEPYVYVTGSVLSWPGVHIVNVGDPVHPTVMGSWSYPYTGSTLGVAALGDTLYVGYNSNGSDPPHAIHILDISDRKAPRRLGSHAIVGGLYNLLVEGQTLYIAGGPDGDFRSLDLSAPTAPVSKLFLNWPGYVQKVRVAGNRAYVSARSDFYGVKSGIWIYDLSNPLLPAVVDYEDPLSSISDFVVVEPYLYVSGQSHLLIRNTNDLKTPLGFYSHDQGICNSVAVQGTVAYVQIVPEITTEPDYSSAIQALKKAAGVQ